MQNLLVPLQKLIESFHPLDAQRPIWIPFHQNKELTEMFIDDAPVLVLTRNPERYCVERQTYHLVEHVRKMAHRPADEFVVPLFHVNEVDVEDDVGYDTVAWVSA